MKRSKKQAKSLANRIADYFKMISDSKKIWDGYKKPGSNSK
jgi:hypothetical protein